MIEEGKNFAFAMTAQLSSHLQIKYQSGPLIFILDKK